MTPEQFAEFNSGKVCECGHSFHEHVGPVWGYSRWGAKGCHQPLINQDGYCGCPVFSARRPLSRQPSVRKPRQAKGKQEALL